jgi:hypothetical protein
VLFRSIQYARSGAFGWLRFMTKTGLSVLVADARWAAYSALVDTREEALTHPSLFSCVLVATLVIGGWTAPVYAAAAKAMPIFEVDKGWPKKPANMKFGDASSIAIDDKDNAWILTRPRVLKAEDKANAAAPITIFDPNGNYIRGWGGEGPGYQWPEREHGIMFDAKGNVWIGGNSCPENGQPGLRPVTDDQLLKFSRDGKFLLQIGKSNSSKGNADTANFHRPADAQYVPATNELFVADGYGNHRVIVVDADTGAFKRMWGAFGNKPVDDDHCQDIFFQQSNALGPPQFSIVHAIRVAKDGMVYVADRENRRVQMFDSNGKFIKQLMKSDAIFARDLALSPDPEQRFLYAGYGKGIAVLDRKSLEFIGTIDSPGIIGPGHHIQTDSKGNLYIAQTTAGVQRLLYKGMSQ